MPIDSQLLAHHIGELFDNAPCGCLVCLPDGTILQVNQTLLAMTGFPPGALLAGKRFQELLTLPGQIYYDTHIGPLLQMNGAAKAVAFDLVRHDDSRLPVLVNASNATLGAQGEQLLLFTLFDATDRRAYETELLAARRRADDAVLQERAAREQAEAAIRAKDDFLAMVSHELRTPLNAILGWTQILEREGGLTPDQAEGLSVIRRNAQVQAELINDLLDMSRIIAGKMRLDVQTVPLADAVTAALDTVRPAADAKQIRLQKILDPAITVAGDPSRLQQVFWNLLINAVKFTPKEGSIRVVMQRVNSHVEVAVTDNGQGMTPEFLLHAFERFRQSSSRETHKTSGLGLGLSIVKHLVEMHGGSIFATSAGPNQGSTFLVSLPITALHHNTPPVEPRAALSPQPLDVRGITLQGLSVLVVDDEADARDLLRRVLTSSGAAVHTANSAAEALRLLDSLRPHVLVSDVGLPGDDGYELIRKIRMLGNDAGKIPAVALTARSRLEDRTRALLSGFQMHLPKPTDARELIVTIATLARK